MNEVLIKSLLEKEYSLRARFLPAFIISIPITLSIVFTVNSLILFNEFSTLHYLYIIGIPFFMMSRIRKKGQNIQTQLWTKWGGNPAAILLNDRDQTFSKIQKEDFLKIIQKIFGLRKANGSILNINQQLDLVIFRLIEINRDNGLLLEENISYGFWRNLYAVRIDFIICALLGIGIATVNYYLLNFVYSHFILHVSAILIYVICILTLISERKVKDAAYNYARTLIKSIYRFERS